MGVTLSLRLHLVNSSDQGAAPLTAPLHVFCERYGALNGETSWSGNVKPDVCEIFALVGKLTAAFDLFSETEVLVYALFLVERLIEHCPGVLKTSTLRPILLTAITISAKTVIDESLSGITRSLAHFGFTGVDCSRVTELEVAFLQTLNWRIDIPRHTFALYGFELRSLYTSHLVPLRTVFPDLERMAAALDSRGRHSRPQERNVRSRKSRARGSRRISTPDSGRGSTSPRVGRGSTKEAAALARLVVASC